MIFKSNIDWDQFARYLAGECTVEEKAVFEARLNSSAEFKAAFEEANRTWAATRRPLSATDKKNAWASVHSRIEEMEGEGGKLRIIHGRSRRPDRRPIMPNSKGVKGLSSWSYVAILLIVALGSWVYLRPNNQHLATDPEVAIFKTTPGQRASITLPDGSEVVLNAESQIRILSTVSDPFRSISLQGEAFFSVKKDSLRPFIVYAGDAEVNVLGTSFNVSAYPERVAVEVVVAGGEVKVNKKGAEAAVYLGKNDIGIVEEAVSVRALSVEDVDELTAWREGRLVFDHAPLDDVAKTLSRWFDLKVRLSDTSLSNRHLTATFEEPTSTYVIPNIASTLSLAYTIEGKKVTFSPPVSQ